uniref:FOG: Ankyrin repeat-like protein n=1 Tax=Solibacter usitatus (strain Ellin6076) TaxID=234267 RepID=Q01RF8_SOLUE
MRSLHLSVIFGVCICQAQSVKTVDFGRDVQPILREHCFGCHGPSQQLQNFRLDQRRAALPNRVGANGARIIAGNRAASRLYQKLTKPQQGIQMPPAGPLSAEQIETIGAWIDQGADWPDAFAGEVPPPTADAQATRLMEALRNGDRKAVSRILQGHPEAVNRAGSGGATPLMYAVLYGDAETVRLFLQHGADPNLRSPSKASALMYAADDPAKTRLLLDRGADANARSNEGETPLSIAAAGRENADVVVKLLLDHGADLKMNSLTRGSALTVAAAFSGNPRLVQLLLEKGAERTPLPLAQAALLDCSLCVETLLPFARQPELNAALTSAVRARSEPLLRMLLARGAKAAPNLLPTLSLTPDWPAPDLLKTLLEQGADIHAVSSVGGTVLGLARRQGKTKLVELLESAGAKSAPDEEARPTRMPSPASSPRAAIERSLPALQRADAGFLIKAGCVSCHSNSLTAMAVAAARKSKLPVNEQIARTQLSAIGSFLERNRERALQSLGVPGSAHTAGYTLLGLVAENYPADTTTDAWAHFLKNTQESDGHWKVRNLRPPIESSDIEVTAAALRSIQVYAPKSRRTEYEKAVQSAAQWMETAQPRDTQDRAFRILGLHWAGGKRDAIIQKAAKDLIAFQRPDGGWAQLPTLASDAYATGQALTALHESGGVPIAHTTYQRGIQFLLNTQLADGSWYVGTRTLPLQRYFDSDFPHGVDQFISITATNWAVMALAPAAR